jgi:hypothetical protein
MREHRKRNVLERFAKEILISLVVLDDKDDGRGTHVAFVSS